MRWMIGEVIVFHMIHGGMFEVSVRGYYRKLNGDVYVIGEDKSGLIHMRNMTDFPVIKEGHKLSKYIA